MIRRALVLATLLAIANGCDAEKKKTEDPGSEIGVGDGDSDPPPGVYVPIRRGDLAEIAKVGRWVDVAARALELANATVVDRMGTVDADVVMPLVDIDPEGTSGQVLFFRWPGAKGSKAPLLVENAERWLLVAMMFGPDRVIDVELLEGEVERNSPEERRIAAMIVAATELQKQAPGQAFFTIDRFQAEETGNKRKPQRIATLVYALAFEPDGPDLEVVVDEPKSAKAQRKKPAPPPVFLRATVVHRKGSLAASPATVAAADPHPLTVARALRSGKAMQVQAESGTYEIAVDGTVARMTTAP